MTSPQTWTPSDDISPWTTSQAGLWTIKRQDFEIPQAVDLEERASEGLQTVRGAHTHTQYVWNPPVVEKSLHEVDSQTPTPQNKRWCFGLRKTTLALTISNIAFAIALVVLGVLLSRRTDYPTPAGVPQTTCNKTETPVVASQHEDSANVCFHTNSAPAAGMNPGSTQSECPLPPAQRRYTVPGTNLTFERECEMDYVGSDMARFPVRSMRDCMALCAQLNLAPSSAFGRCVAVTWVHDTSRWGPQGTDIAFCFPKNRTDPRARDAKGGVESAVLLTA